NVVNFYGDGIGNPAVPNKIQKAEQERTVYLARTRKARRRRSILIASAALLLVIGIGLGAWVWQLVQRSLRPTSSVQPEWLRKVLPFCPSNTSEVTKITLTSPMACRTIF